MDIVHIRSEGEASTKQFLLQYSVVKHNNVINDYILSLPNSSFCAIAGHCLIMARRQAETCRSV
jgi:hypothetical protein